MELRPRPPFRLDLTDWALRRQPHNAIDRWDGRTWRRVLAVGDGAIELQVDQRGPAEAAVLDVRLGGTGPGADDEARAAATRILGLDADLSGFYRMAAADPRLTPLAARYRGMHPQRFPDLFEALANAVACQQVSLNVGIALLGRLARRHSRPLPGDGGAYAFPHEQDLRLADPAALRQDGWSRQKIAYLLDIASAVGDESWRRRLEAASDADAYAELVRLRGVGRWSAQYALLRGLGRWSAFPLDDVGARKYLGLWLGLPAAPDARTTDTIVSRWQPYAGLVYFHLLLWRLERSGAIAADSRG